MTSLKDRGLLNELASDFKLFITVKSTRKKIMLVDYVAIHHVKDILLELCMSFI